MIAPRMKTCPACGLVFPDESSFCFLSGDSLEPAADALVGTTLAGRFRIESVIHDGPWAKVYAARYRMLNRPLVVKVLKASLDADDRRAFLDAVAKARRCTHPNVLELVCGGVSHDLPYLVHPQLQGVPLSRLLSQGNFAPARALGIGLQLLEALGRIHDFGAVHGSVRPSNILVTSSRGGDHVDLVDVGLGRSLLRDPWDDDPASLHAQRYLAPELSSQQRQSANADIYAVGVIVHELLTGTVPFEAGSVADLRDKINIDTTLDLGVPLEGLAEPLRGWLTGMLSRAVTKRPQNAHAAVELLLSACSSAGLTPAPDPGRSAGDTPAQMYDGFARWERFRALFEKMLQVGFPGGAPKQTHDTLAQIQGRIEQLAELGKKALYEHGNLEDVLTRAREGRQSIADQMDALNEEAKDIRAELHPLRVAAERHADKARAFPEKVAAQHKQVLSWEGRSAFMEPYRELAEAYRGMAELIDKWWSVRNAQLTCERDAAAKEEQLQAFDGQLDELREALRIHESNLAAEISACEETLASIGMDADRIEFELLDLASRFSAPLRSKPELGACFRELARA